MFLRIKDQCKDIYDLLINMNNKSFSHRYVSKTIQKRDIDIINKYKIINDYFKDDAENYMFANGDRVYRHNAKSFSTGFVESIMNHVKEKNK